MYDDKTLICRGCGASFSFTAGEQEFYDRKGFESAPGRCPECRKTDRSGSGYSGGLGRARYGGGDAHGGAARPEQLFSAACAQCGRDTQASARLILGSGTIYCPECTPPEPDAAVTINGGWRESW